MSDYLTIIITFLLPTVLLFIPLFCKDLNLFERDQIESLTT